MDKKSLTGHILFHLHQAKHWVYFALIFCIAIGVWSIFFEDTNKNIENTQLSSFSKKSAEVRKAEIASINRLSITPQAADGIIQVKKTNFKKLPPRFEDNPAFKFFVYVKELLNKSDQTLNRKIASDPVIDQK